MKTLIVEDDLSSRIILQQILNPYGSCTIAVNGLEAVELFKIALAENSRFDLVCLDIMMPVMDGLQALKKMREIEHENKIDYGDETYIVMMTALDTPQDVISAYYEGSCSSYTVKPINKRKLLTKLREDGLIK